MGYVYRGTEFDAHLPLEDEVVRKPRDTGPIVCGTVRGYVQHRRNNEGACQPCRTANAEYKTEYKWRARARLIKKGWTPAKCGTTAGYAAHRWFAVPVCEPCRAANAAACKERREARKVAA